MVSHPVVEFTNQVQLSNPDVLSDEAQFGNIDLEYAHVFVGQAHILINSFCRRIKNILSTRAVPTAHQYVAGRVANKFLVQKPQGTGTAICPKGVPGEVADIVIFGFVLASNIVEGRTYKSATGTTRVLKELEILPIQQDWERAVAALSMIFGSKLVNLVVTDDGAITFSTKHTTVDEDGNAAQKSESCPFRPPRFFAFSDTFSREPWRELPC